MKIIIKAEPNDQNLMEFDVDKSGFTEEELLRNVIAVATEWLTRIEEDKIRT